MQYDIYYHDDFDGRASAAMMLAFLKSRGDGIARYVPLTYGFEKAWLAADLSKKKHPAIVVDFLYHPKAAWWFDHHPTGFRKEAWRSAFRPDAQHHYDRSYGSACHLVYDALVRDFGWKPPRHLKELARVLDVFDSAKYPSARVTIEMKGPAYEVGAFIEALDHTVAEDKFLIGRLAAEPLARVAKAPRVARAVKALRKKMARSLAFYKKNIEKFGSVTFVDATKDPLNGFLRYAPYYFYPRSMYGIRIREKGKGVWYLGVGANPWRRSENRFELGKLMRERYGGGGHKGIGATEFRTRADAMKVVEVFKKLLDR